MDTHGITIPKIKKQSIKEIFRACRRLCVLGRRKMLTIQKVDVDSGEVELKHKIRECVQIEVHQDDKMSPLICELCFNKVNDLYEFLEMCQKTNKQTGLWFGLLPQSLPRAALMPKRKEKEGESSGKQPRLLGRRVFCRPSRILRGTKRTHADDVSLNKKQLMPKKDFEKEKEKEGESSCKQPRLLGRKVPCPPPRSPPRKLRGTKRTHADGVSLNKKQSEKPMEITGLREKEIENEANSQKVDNPVERDPTPPPKKLKKTKCRDCGIHFPSRDMCNIHQCSDRAAPIDPELLKQCRPLLVKISKCDVDYSEKRMEKTGMREKEMENKADSQKVVKQPLGRGDYQQDRGTVKCLNINSGL